MPTTTHSVRQLSGGGIVLALDNGAVIGAETEAMLQALYSRSESGILDRLRLLEQQESGNFMQKYYVGYGHRSIGDCGRATLFIEGISLLAEKALQDWRLYSGQVTSTRYLDFSQRRFLDPAGGAGAPIQERWRRFYLEALEPLRSHLKARHPKSPGEPAGLYDKAIAARAFDILRGFLPAGVTVNLASSMNFRQFADQLMLLRHHPLPEVREIARKAQEVLSERYPHSFGQGLHRESEEYNADWMARGYYFTHPGPLAFGLASDLVDRALLSEYRGYLSRRPAKTDLPPAIAECGTLVYQFGLDFGAFRDLQRHRSVTQRMPLLDLSHGFEPWFLDALPGRIREKAEALLSDQEGAIGALGLPVLESQYYVAQGYRVPCRLSGDLKSLVYLAELRASRFVHPTLCALALKLAGSLAELFGERGLVLHLDREPGRFDVARGGHDITEVSSQKEATAP